MNSVKENESINQLSHICAKACVYVFRSGPFAEFLHTPIYRKKWVVQNKLIKKILCSSVFLKKFSLRNKNHV